VSRVKDLSLLSDKQLLDQRICDLPLKIRGTFLERCADRLYAELEAHRLRFKPHIWLSAEWFTPDKIPGFAIPFYLAHPRLARLERKQMLEIEGGTEKECMRIMRHEAGHAIDNAFLLHSRRRYRELFGAFSRPYPNWYKPQPNSRDFVLHLPAWYAQSHPAEDFAETFAVWMTPGARWRKQYANWRALRKLEYVDKIMHEIAGKAPLNKSRAKAEQISEISATLRDHYRLKRSHYDFEWPADYDRDLRRIFSSEERHRSRMSAVVFLRRHRRELCAEVSEGTGLHNYAIDQMFVQMINRCRDLKLRVGLTSEQVRRKVLVMLTVQTMSGLHTGYQRIAL
jgi:hypothetical protein